MTAASVFSAFVSALNAAAYAHSHDSICLFFAVFCGLMALLRPGVQAGESK